MMRKTVPGMVFILALAIGFAPPEGTAGNVSGGKPGVGDLAPLFSANDISGNKVTLEDALKSGKVVLLNFWGLRCSTCLEEIGYLNPMHENYREKGVLIIGVNVDGVDGEFIKKSIPRLSNIPKFTVLSDPEFRISDLYNMMASPLSFVIGKDGKVLYRHEDFKPADAKAMEEAILQALAKGK